MSSPTRFPGGLTNVRSTYSLGSYPQLDPTKICQDFDDFNNYAAGDWTVTNTTSHATVGLIAGAGGLAQIIGGGSSVTNDIGAVIANPLNFNLPANTDGATLIPPSQAWFVGSMRATTALNDQLQMGVTSANAALAPTDGIYFNKAAASAAVTFVVRKGSASLAATAYSTGTTTVATLVDATALRLSWYYNGKGTIYVFANNAMVCSVDVGVSTNLVAATFPQATALGMGFGIKAAATAPTTGNIIVDYLLAAQTRV